MHIPVLLNEVLQGLNIKPGDYVVDGTANGGGHSLAIAERVFPKGKVLAIEWDRELFERLQLEILNTKFQNTIVCVNDSYVNMADSADKHGFKNCSGVLLDLGLSSWHLELSGRGFSFLKEEPLDMRYSEKGETAAELLSRISREELAEILKNYGEERFAGRIAESIVNARRKAKIDTSLKLTEIIKKAVPFGYRRGRIHFATRTFQALRIAVNQELNNVEAGLKAAETIIAKGGRLAVITFHSLEDRIVKNFMRDGKKQGTWNLITAKPIRPTLTEVQINHRSRSAKLRIAEKI